MPAVTREMTDLKDEVLAKIDEKFQLPKIVSDLRVRL